MAVNTNAQNGQINFKPAILTGDVMHARLFPRINKFRYRMYYLIIPLSQLAQIPLSQKRFSWMSFRPHDHGNKDGTKLQSWAQQILQQYNVKNANGEIVLVALPRIFGYVFNPVSFWLCHDKSGTLKAVICQVNNTFGETHTYLCICDKNGVMHTNKTFHVSPFLPRNGSYQFKFKYNPNTHLAAFIDYYHENGDKQLATYLKGDFQPMTCGALIRVFFAYPLITFKAITLIHWQALKLLVKKIKYIKKPKQNEQTTGVTKIL